MMLKLFNQSCSALHPLKTRLISGFLRRPGFVGAQFAAHSTAAVVKMDPREEIRKVEEKFGISWKSTCFPLSPEISRKTDSDEEFRTGITELWRSVEPDELVPSSDLPQPGDISLSALFGTGGYLVRSNGDRVDLNADTLRGKYVFVCCFPVPQTLYCCHIIDICDELCSSRDDVEVVMAAWINTSVIDGDDHKLVFDHFFSAFPKSCLALPFEDSKRRASVCKLVADYNSSKLRYFPCLVLDTEGMVLPPFKSWTISSYGAAAFPFTQEILDGIKARDKQLRKSTSLEQLLLINRSSPDVVYRFNPEGGPREEVRISELNSKLVGLYMPGRSCDLFPTLVNIYKQCLKKQLEFEIVVAEGSDQEIDRLLLKKHDICRQWWRLPLNNSVSARLDRVVPLYKWNRDKLCVVGPAGGFIDVYAPSGVMKLYEVDGYPFTREAVVQKEASKMREITLESVLLGDGLFRGTDRDDVTCAEKLLGRKISVYFGCLHYMWDHDKVLLSYRETKAKDPGFEVVFVYLKNDRDSAELVKEVVSAMPWYVCSFELSRLESTREKLGINTATHAIVGFGEDGRVHSCRPADSATFTLDDTLYEDVSKRLTHLPPGEELDSDSDSD